MKEQRHVKYAQVYHLAKYIENELAREWEIENISFVVSPLFDVIQFGIDDFNVRFEIRFFNAYNYRQIMRRLMEVKLQSERKIKARKG